MSLSEKVEVLRVQLGLKQGLPLAEVVLQAVQQLGLGAEVGGLNLVQKVDACLSMLSLPAATSTSTVVPDEMEREPTGLEPGMQITVNTPQGPIQTVPDGVETGQQFQIHHKSKVSRQSFMGVPGEYKIWEGSPLEDKGKTASISGPGCIYCVCFKKASGQGESCTVMCCAGPGCFSNYSLPVLCVGVKDEDTLTTSLCGGCKSEFRRIKEGAPTQNDEMER